jgi:hypothetical protein
MVDRCVLVSRQSVIGVKFGSEGRGDVCSKNSPLRDPPVSTFAPLAIVSVTIGSTLAAWRSLTIGAT